jgi:steroid delta-isomerase-like uncharacterized protein
MKKITQFVCVWVVLLQGCTGAVSPLETNKDLVRRYVDEVLNQKKMDKMEGYFTPDFSNHTKAAGNSLSGLKNFLVTMNKAFPERKTTIQHLVAEGDKVIVLAEWEGVQFDTYFGVPASYKRLTTTTSDVFRISNGKIAEHWDVTDNLDIMLAIDAVKRVK